MVTKPESTSASRDEVGLAQPRHFAGELSYESDRCAVTALIHVDESGEVVFALDPLVYTNESRFLFQLHHSDSEVGARLRFSAEAPEGIQFETPDFHMAQCALDAGESGTRLRIAGECLTAT